jgi:hypothetical protein
LDLDVVRPDPGAISMSYGPSSSLDSRNKSRAFVTLVLVPEGAKAKATPSIWMELIAAFCNGTKAGEVGCHIGKVEERIESSN